MAMGEGWKKNLEVPQDAPRPWWTTMAAWFVMGAFVGAGVFAWTARRELGSMVKDPRALAVGRDLKQAAKDFAEEYIPAAKKWEGDTSPEQPSADRLVAPIDPANTRGRVVGRQGTTDRSLGVRRRAGEKAMKSATDAEEYRQDMNMPVLRDEFVVPFWNTDLGRGIKYSACFAIFFGSVGYLMFMIQNKHGRTY